jgi:exodeoxyribonuclease VII large subunit
VTPRLRAELLERKVERLSEKLAAVWKMAELVHPERPLSKGFVRVTDRAGQTLTSADAARSARALSLHFKDGLLAATAGEGAPAAPLPPATTPPRVERKARATYVAPQPGLFD